MAHPDNGSPPPPPPLASAMHDLLAAQADAVRALGRHLDLGANDLASLQFLMGRGPETDNPVGPAELAEHLGITTASATALVDRLETRRLVKRHPHPSDRRRRVLALTSKATRIVGRAMEPLREAEANLHQTMTEQDRETVARFLTATAAIYRDYGEGLG